MKSKLLSVEEAAEKLKVSTQTITRFIRLKKLPAEKVGKRAYVIRESDLKLASKRPRGRPPGTPDSKPRKPRRAKAGPIEEGEEKE